MLSQPVNCELRGGIGSAQQEHHKNVFSFHLVSSLSTLDICGSAEEKDTRISVQNRSETT